MYKMQKCLKECNSKSIYEGDEFYKIDTKECFVCGDCKEICPKKIQMLTWCLTPK